MLKLTMPVTGQLLCIIVNGASASGFWKCLWLTARRYYVNNEWTHVFSTLHDLNSWVDVLSCQAKTLGVF